MGDLTIVVSVRLGRTMSQYAMPKNRKLTFVNDSDEDLVIRPKHGAAFPLVDQNLGDPIGTFTVRPGDSETVRINKSFTGGEFLYEAQIGSATPEDPIVILERPR